MDSELLANFLERILQSYVGKNTDTFQIVDLYREDSMLKIVTIKDNSKDEYYVFIARNNFTVGEDL